MHCRFLTIVHHSHFRYDPFSGWEPQIGLDCTREDNYGLRYLRMLVACVKSVFRLHDQKVLPLLAATDVTIVSLTAPLHDADSEWRSGLAEAVIEEIKGRAPADALWPAAASEWIRSCANSAGMPRDRETSHLHAEAGLMALACKTRLSGGSGGDECCNYGSPVFTVCITS